MAVPEVLVGTPTGTPSTNISAYIEPGTLKTEDTGNQTDDTATFEVVDKAIAITAIVPNGRIKVTRDSKTIFNGFITTKEPVWKGIGRRFSVTCTSISTLLDKCIIPPDSNNTYVRNNSESDKARIKWLLETFGEPFTDAGSSSFAFIQKLENNMPRQNFANLTLRQAIERVLGAASESANYYVDTLGRIHTWDNDHLESLVAPFAVVAEPTLAAGDEVAPSDLRVMWDTSELINYYYVRGVNAAGSGAQSDATSIATYGRFQAFIDGPDSDTTTKRRRLGKAALKDTKNPIVRTAFTVDADYCENGSGEIWLPGQVVSITSAAHDMSAYEQRIFRVTTSYLNSLGDRSVQIEAGALRLHGLGGGVGGGGGSGRGFYPDPTLVVQPGPPVVDGPIGGIGGSEPDDPDVVNGEHVLDDWTRLATTYPAELDAETTTSTGTSHSLTIPAGVGDGRLLLLAYTTTEGNNAPGSAAAAQGWTLLESFTGVGTPTTSGGVYAFFITAGNLEDVEVPLEFTTPGSETVVARIALIEAGPADGSGITSDITTPPNGHITPSVSGWVGENELAYVFGFDSEAVAGGDTPTYVLQDDLVSGATGLRVLRGDLNGAFNPGDFTASGSGEQHSVTVGIRFVEPEWGRIPFGQGVDTDAPWEGGNLYHPVIVGSATLSTSGGVGLIAVTADGTSVSMLLRSDAPDDLNDEPWGPWSDATAQLVYVWKVNVLGDLADADPNYIEWKVITQDWRGTFRVNLGDAETWVYQSGGDERGIVVGQTSSEVWSDFVPKTLVADTYYQTRFDFRDTRVRMKLWTSGDDEPAEWDIDVARVAEDDGADDVAQLYINIEANDGMTFSFDQAYAQTGEGPAGSQEPGDETLPRGDGVRVTWTVRPWVGAIWIYVDGILTEPQSSDAALGTFTFSRAPADGAYLIALYKTA